MRPWGEIIFLGAHVKLEDSVCRVILEKERREYRSWKDPCSLFGFLHSQISSRLDFVARKRTDFYINFTKHIALYAKFFDWQSANYIMTDTLLMK